MGNIKPVWSRFPNDKISEVKHFAILSPPKHLDPNYFVVLRDHCIDVGIWAQISSRLFGSGTSLVNLLHLI